MNTVILSADSTCDLGRELQQRYQVNFYPLHILLEGRDYLDNVNISTEEIYQAFHDRKALPKTAAVNVEEYRQYFEKLTADGAQVVHINLGSAISSSYQNCVLAAKERCV